MIRSRSSSHREYLNRPRCELVRCWIFKSRAVSPAVTVREAMERLDCPEVVVHHLVAVGRLQGEYSPSGSLARVDRLGIEAREWLGRRR